jgi:uncharacterized membrane protein (Fun14 family)
MYAGHLAAGLALRGRARNIPVAAFLIGAFLLDLLWIAFGVLWVDHTPRDDWSHSLAMGMVWATAFAVPFWRSGRAALIAMWLAVFSHYVLDLAVQGAALYPNAPPSLLIPALTSDYARPLQLAFCALLMMIFLGDERSAGLLSWRSWVICAGVLALNGRFLLGV